MALETQIAAGLVLISEKARFHAEHADGNLALGLTEIDAIAKQLIQKLRQPPFTPSQPPNKEQSVPQSFSRSSVDVFHGGGDTFWDVSFSQEQLAYAEAAVEDLKSISVLIDPTSGALTLNHGYESRSPEWQTERSLFDNFRDAIVHALAEDVPARDEYSAFLAAANRDAEERKERLLTLEHHLAEHGLDAALD